MHDEQIYFKGWGRGRGREARATLSDPFNYLGFQLNLLVSKIFCTGQIMNTSYEPFRIVNTYGAFGSVTKNRTEVVLEGTWDEDPRNPNANWMEYDFPCKPGDLTQRPCLISPYHYRYVH
jgi:hypothetical protein